MKILISDGTIHNRKHLAAFLGQNNLEVVGMAGSGEETLALVGALQPTIILLDVSLPCEDVYQLIADLRRTNHPPAVILMTTRPDPQVVRRGLLAGASACLAKSEGIDPFIKAIQNIQIKKEQGD